MKVDFVGFDELDKSIMRKIYRVENDGPKILKKNLGQLMEKEQRETHLQYTKGYSTNETKQSISIEVSGDGLEGSVGPKMAYNVYTEYGTRFMNPAPIVEPHSSEQKKTFIKEMEDLING